MLSTHLFWNIGANWSFILNVIIQRSTTKRQSTYSAFSHAHSHRPQYRSLYVKKRTIKKNRHSLFEDEINRLISLSTSWNYQYAINTPLFRSLWVFEGFSEWRQHHANQLVLDCPTRIRCMYVDEYILHRLVRPVCDNRKIITDPL